MWRKPHGDPEDFLVSTSGASGGMAGGADALPLLREVCLRALDSVTRGTRGSGGMDP